MLKWEQFTIAIPRNGHYQEDWQLCARSADGKSWEPIDLTGHTLSLRFKSVAGQGSVIASATLDVYEPVLGKMTVSVRGADFSAVAGSSEIVTIAYDLSHKYPDNIIKVYPRGHALLIPGVS